MLAFGGQPCVNPILFAAGVVSNVRVAQRRQFTGDVLRSISSGLSAVDHDVGGLVGQQRGSELLNLVGRQINRAG